MILIKVVPAAVRCNFVQSNSKMESLECGPCGNIKCPSSSEYKKLNYKVALAGIYGVGKTSVFRRMFNLQFCEGKPPSAIESEIHDETFTDEKIIIGLNIWDTVDMDKHGSITQSYYRGCHFVLLVYSADDKTSLHKLKFIADNVRNYEPSAKLILVRNKTDLPVDTDSVTQREENSFVHNLQHRIQAKYATSAKENNGITELLRGLAKHALAMFKTGGKKPIDYKTDGFKIHLEQDSSEEKSCCS